MTPACHTSPGWRGPVAVGAFNPVLGQSSIPRPGAITLLALWVWTCLQLAPVWRAYPNYHFGFLVPWIAALLAARSFLEKRPTFAPPGIGISKPLLVAGLATAWTLFLFAELERQVDPHWRLVIWTMAAAATALTALALLRLGGMPLLKQFAFPVAFLWTALPWPSAWEDAVTLQLRLFVTRMDGRRPCTSPEFKPFSTATS